MNGPANDKVVAAILDTTGGWLRSAYSYSGVTVALLDPEDTYKNQTTPATKAHCKNDYTGSPAYYAYCTAYDWLGAQCA